MVKHHVPDEFLMAYSAGILSESFSLVVAAHVSLSDDSRARMEAYDAVGGAVLDNTETAELAPGSLEATLDRILGAAPMVSPPKPASEGVLPKPLQGYIGGDLEAVKWRPVGMGVRQAILKKDGATSVRLLYIPKGMAMPDHGHGGTEMTLVLQGAYRDDDGEFHRGDIEVANVETQHTPIAIGTEDCICLIATDARLKFTSILPRLAQPFLRI